MESHKMLYKNQRSNTPSHLKKMNRELQEANRCKSRRDRFQDSRNISPTPICLEKEVTISLCPVNEEKAASLEKDPNTTRIAKIVCKATNPDKLTRQEAYLKRFIEYKEKKKNMKNLSTLINKKKPFISAVNSNIQKTSSSLVPIGHHEGFRPPVGLKTPINKEKVEMENKCPVAKGRQSIYTVVATPPRKQYDESYKNKFPTANKIKKNNSNIKTPLEKKLVVSKNITVSKPKPVVNNLMKNPEEVKSTLAEPLSRKNLRPRVLKMPPPPPPKTRVATTDKSRPTGAISKIIKRTEVEKQRKNSPLRSGCARLAQNLKAKKPLNTTKSKLRILQIEGKKVKILQNNHPVEDVVLKTPVDFACFNNFDEFVTSTQIKSSNHTVENGGLNAIGTSQKQSSSSSSSAKRNILQDTNATLLKGSDQNVANNIDENSGATELKKFNFIRYSYCNDEMQIIEKETTPIKFGPKERPANYLSPYVSVARGKVSLKTEKEKRRSIYLQSVPASEDLPTEGNRENYSAEIRRTLEAVRYFRKQLNDEIDRLHRLCNIWEVYKNENLEKIQNASGEDMINVTIGQTRLLTSKKFMQFKGLIDRCESGATGINHVKCDGSEDTKPITSEDLEGFWSMLGIQIDNLDKRFENMNRWKLNDWKDPDAKDVEIKKKLTKVKKAKSSIAAKARPNSALQQMLRKMQAEMRKNKNNENSNDVVVLTIKENHESSGNSQNTTPRRSLDNSASRRLSIIVKDRKYFSPAATVISVSSPNRRARKSSQDSPKMLTHVKKFNDALDSLQSSLGLRKSVLINENSRRMSLKSQLSNTEMLNNGSKLGNDIFDSERDFTTDNHKCISSQSPLQMAMPTGRKSILKTPGTAKSTLRNVIFNEKLRVKKLNFLINEDGTPYNAEDGDDTLEEDLAKGCEDESQSTESLERILTLRNRKVRLRPSCEIVIPKNKPI